MVRSIRLTHLSVGALLLLLLGATPALAGPLEVKVIFDGKGNGEDVSVAYQGNPLNVFAGQLKMHIDVQPTSPFLAFCVDLDHFITSSYHVFKKSTADGLNNGRAISYLYQTYGESPLDNAHAAALQLAIWDELVDGGDGLGAGSFRFSGDAGLAGLVAFYENAALGHSATGLWLDASASGSDSHRGQNVVMSGTTLGSPAPLSAVAVPEPTSLALLGLGGAALALLCRRKVAA